MSWRNLKKLIKKLKLNKILQMKLDSHLKKEKGQFKPSIQYYLINDPHPKIPYIYSHKIVFDKININ